MGIKGIYGEIGPGERISLQKLAIETHEQNGRPLRIAVDISIWLFQIQAGQGGSNPAIRTFYYRLLRLLSLSVQPLFVFDGPHKPPFKRNRRTGHQGATVSQLLAKQLIKLFGFPFHIAPGEAEAECALLQREGIVDAVLSEDVDTLMFGCGLTLRNWSSEGVRGNKSPTHVSVYDAQATKNGKSGLDREGMILVALMSGGDYVTEGIPGCGIKVACEAARAGYGKALCKLSRTDAAGLGDWRRALDQELQTNESGYFRVKHKSLRIPENFPDREVLGYYTHPVVSSASKIRKLKDELMWDGEVDIPGLRLFVAEAFEWSHKTGARKFIRGLAPAMLIYKLRARGERRDSGYGDIVLTAMNEMELVRAICGKRTHFSTDGIPELRVIYHPADIVDIDMDAEEDDTEDYGRDGLAPVNDEDDVEAYISDVPTSTARSSPTKKGPGLYDPALPDKVWIPETIAKIGIPLKVEDYEESLRDPRKFMKAKYAAKRAATKGGMTRGAMDRFVQVSKPGVERGGLTPEKSSLLPSSQPIQVLSNSAPSPRRFGPSPPTPTKASSRSSRDPHPANAAAFLRSHSSISRSERLPPEATASPKPSSRGNGRNKMQSGTNQHSSKITKYIGQQTKASAEPHSKSAQPQIYDLTSSPTSPPCVPLPSGSWPLHLQNLRSTNTSNNARPEQAPSNRNTKPARLNDSHDFEPLQETSQNHGFYSIDRDLSHKIPNTSSMSKYNPSQITPCHQNSPTPKTSQRAEPQILLMSPLLSPNDRSESLEIPTMAEVLSPITSRYTSEGNEQTRLKRIEDAFIVLSSPLQASKSILHDDALPSSCNNELGNSIRANRRNPDRQNLKHSPELSSNQQRPSFARNPKDNQPSSIEDTHISILQKEQTRRPPRKYIALRESLPGGWKEVDEREVEAEVRKGGRKGGNKKIWRESLVDVVDLSRE